MNTRKTLGGVLIVLSLLALAAAAYLFWGCGQPTISPPTRPAPSAPETPLPTFTPYIHPTPVPTLEASLRVACNAAADLALVDARTESEVARGSCTEHRTQEWKSLRSGDYLLRYVSSDLDYRDERPVTLAAGENEKQVLLPGILEIEPAPMNATVEVDGQIYTGRTRLVYLAPQCPFTATVWVLAQGYEPYGIDLRIVAGTANHRSISLQRLPTPVPPPSTASPPGVTAPPPPPATPVWTVEERVALVQQKLYDSANCTRAENGMGPLPYAAELQGLADEMARAWRDYYLANGPNGFDVAPWQQRFQTVGGFAVPETAGLLLYAPDYYIYMGPDSHWETFDMCDPSCRVHGIFWLRKDNLLQASGVTIGLAPWWDGDVLNAALVFAVRW